MTEDCYDFEYVRAKEFEAIEKARKDIPGSGTGKDDLLGLAFSGGGIRSATFNLGVLQGLSRAGLLKHVDYLSTVSGGGYIGSWLSAWIWREGGKVTAVEQALGNLRDPDLLEPRPVGWLRRYSNYLTAKVGLFSADTLTAVATYLRNLLLNQFELVALLGAVLILPMLLTWMLHNVRLEGLWAGVGVLAFTVAMIFINLNFYHRDLRPGDAAQAYQKRTAIVLLIILPLIVSGAALGFAVAELRASSFSEFLFKYWALAFGFTIFTQIVTWLIHKWRAANSAADALSAVKASASAVAAGQRPAKPAEYRYGFFDLARIAAGLGVAVAVGLAGLWLFRELLPSAIRQIGSAAPDPGAIWHVSVWAIPAALLAFGVSTIFFLGIVGRVFSEENREWWSRLGGLLLGPLLAWILIAGTAVYGPFLVGLLGHWLDGVGFAWILTSAAGVVAGRSRFSSGAGKSTAAASDDKAWVNWIAKVAPYIFIAGLLLLVATALNSWLMYFAAEMSISRWNSELRSYSSFSAYAESLAPLLALAGGNALLIVLGVLAGVVLLFALTLDVNVFSFHMFYRNRLVRCYLGASNDSSGKRKPHPFTGFDPTDSPKMTDLAAQRPYHIINAALNLTRASNLAWQERKAASFAIAPLFCGYDLEPGARSGNGRYQSTDCYLAGDDCSPGASNGWIGLGTALAISGAAASPNMGYHTSSATALLLAVFNVRLGWWMQNTRSRRNWGRKGPRFGILWMIYELFALAHEERRFVYLSDGGHFENLGIYELARRRCRFIIAVDAGCDPDFAFADLGNAVRKCQVDLGVRIDIDPRAVVPGSASGRSTFHCAVGEVHYPVESGEKQVGLLLYIKPSLTGNEPADVAEYAAAHADFPHQKTADQWFDESQFESYRNLGQHVTSTLLESVGGSAEPEWIFHNLKERWYRPAKATAGAFAQHANQLKVIEAALRENKDLEFMDGQLFPEWPRLLAGAQPPAQLQLGLPANGGQRRAGFYLCASMLQLMETVYHDLNLEEEWGHPDNRGWINVFKHWSWSGMFMATFSVCCGMYGARFQRWCERHLELWPGKVTTEIRPAPDDEKKISPWLHELEKKDEINFVEMNELAAMKNGGFAVVKPGDSLVLLRMECKSSVAIPAHRGGAGAELISFTFGIAVVARCVNDETGMAHPDALVYFRIQDHLRRMGLARRAMRELVHGGKLPVSNVCWPKDAPNRSEVERIFNSVRKEQPDLRNRKI